MQMIYKKNVAGDRMFEPRTVCASAVCSEVDS